MTDVWAFAERTRCFDAMQRITRATVEFFFEVGKACSLLA